MGTVGSTSVLLKIVASPLFPLKSKSPYKHVFLFFLQHVCEASQLQ